VKHIALSLLALTLALSAQERTSALKDLSNVDPATGRTALDVYSKAESDGLTPSVDNASVNAAIGEDPAATQAAILLEPSTIGGANKVIQTDGNGNIVLGPVDNRVGGVYLASGFTGVGNIYIPDQQGLIWRDPADGAAIFNIRMWRGHDAIRGEAIIESAWRIALLGQGPIQFGHNDANRTAQVLHMTSGAASPTNPIQESRGISQQTNRYGTNGTDGTVGYSIMQTTSDSATSNSTVVKFNIVDGTPASTVPTVDFNGPVSVTNGGVANGNTVFQIRNSGITAPALALQTGGITFADTTTLDSTDDIEEMITLQTAPRTGHVELVAGTATVADASITGFTEIILTHKEPSGTLGHLSAVKDYGVGFDIVSTSATDASTVSYLLVEGTTSDIPAPSISGTNEIGDTLTVTGGVGGRQWKANGSNISGQTGSTYVIGAAYIGQSITCEVGGVPSNAITAWHPDDESGYFADFRADAGLFQTVGGSAATLHGDLVAEWQDQSGNNRHLGVLGTGNRPSLDLTTYAGYPHLNFDGTDDYMFDLVTLSRPHTVFIVAESKSETSNERYFSTADSGTRMIVEPPGPATLDVRNNGAATTGDQMPLNTRKIITARTNSTVNAVRVNSGTEVAATETTGNGIGMYVSGTSAATAANQRHYALIVYSADLDASAQARVRKYLYAKWGITS